MFNLSISIPRACRNMSTLVTDILDIQIVVFAYKLTMHANVVTFNFLLIFPFKIC